MSMRKALKRLDRRIRYIMNRDKLRNQYKEVKQGTPPWQYTKRVPLCPVCGAEMKHETSIMEHIMHEEHMTCPNYCYSYEFVTGSHETRVGNVTVHEHYTDTKEEREFAQRIINMAIIFEREWRKQREKTSGGHEST
jgi:hypothetical protein